MKQLFICVAAALCLLLSGCGMNYEAVMNQNVTQSEVVLSKNNFKVLGRVVGESTQSYIFGIGGLSSKSLESSAINDMYNNVQSYEGKSIAVINVHVAYKYSWVLIFMQKKALATGTVIEFIDE